MPRTPTKTDNLTDMQRAFCMALLDPECPNPTQAAIRAGYESKKASATACKLMKMRTIEDYLAERRKDTEVATQVTPERIIRELARIAFGNLGDVAEWRGQKVTLRSSSELTKDALAQVKNVAGATKNGGAKIAGHDKLKALELLGNHFGLFRQMNNDGNEHEIVDFEVIPYEDVVPGEDGDLSHLNLLEDGKTGKTAPRETFDE